MILKVSVSWINTSVIRIVFKCSAGSSFILCGHLWVIISDPFGTPEQVIIANLTSKKPTSDTTVVLSDGDHNFIKHDTVVNYADSRIEPSEYIETRIHDRDFELRDNFRSETLHIIQQGLIDSPRTPNNIKRIFRNLNPL